MKEDVQGVAGGGNGRSQPAAVVQDVSQPHHCHDSGGVTASHPRKPCAGSIEGKEEMIIIINTLCVS